MHLAGFEPAFPIMWAAADLRRRPPPHCWGFTIILRHSRVGRTPLGKSSARRRDLYLTTHKTHNRQISMTTGGIRTRNPRTRAAADPRLRTRGHWDRHLIFSPHQQTWISFLLYKTVQECTRLKKTIIHGSVTVLLREGRRFEAS